MMAKGMMAPLFGKKIGQDTEEDLGAPEPIEDEGMPSKSASKQDNPSTPPGYTGPEQRCESCQHFDGEAKCVKFDSAVDAQGHCSAHEGPESSEKYDESGEDQLEGPSEDIEE
jgi:hypothetical protein